MSPLARLLSLPVHGYRLVLSPWVGRSCRFQPTCSEYALDALRIHGGLKGGAMAFWRICRCNPWGGSGFDPVAGPEAQRHGPHCGCGHPRSASAPAPQPEQEMPDTVSEKASDPETDHAR